MKTHLSLLLIAFFCLTGCTPSKGQSRPAAATQPAPGDTLDVETIERVVGVEGTKQGGEYKITVPQNDLDVTVDGFKIIPPMGMGSWAVFAPAEEGALVMGDIVVREEEVGPVEQVLIQQGLTATALHKHFLQEEPRVNYMHIGGMGTEEELARGVRAVLDKIAELRGGDPAEAEAQTVENTLDTTQIADILGHSGAMSRGVYKVTIGRPDVALTSHGIPVTTFMGFNTWAAWQGTPENAAVAGDFTMLENEVAPVIEALVENGIEVVAVHNHMVHEEPRIFFLHYWGTGPAEELARGLRAALDQTGAPSSSQSMDHSQSVDSSQATGAPFTGWTFNDVAVGALPQGWKTEQTNPRGQGAQWSVQEDATAPSDDRVLALTDTRGASGSTFNVAWTDRATFKDGKIEVAVKTGTGEEDQGGGPIWRVQDKDNYYIARWNPLEDNFRLYYVKDGHRKQLESARVRLSPDEWHTILVDHQGSRITAYLDGEKMFETTDDTFTEAGGVGVWTKADAATFFDDLTVTGDPAEIE